ncbi:MAG: ParB family chromosome partitioning protein [Rhodococcus sp. (in: high G+C Gram-positive bacteria)]|jgi:ParB family chromosome partitioning protein
MLVSNPRNPRDEIGDLTDLASIAEKQLQPGLAISRGAFLKIWPEDESKLGDAKYVVVNGNRRLAAANKYGRDGLDVVLRDSIAPSRGELLWAATSENIDRRDFDVIEEAKAVEGLVAEFGSADKAAEKLGRTKGWVSQRRALLKLAPELQAALRAGDLAIRHARSLAQVPLEEQVAAWRTAQDDLADKANKKQENKGNPKPKDPDDADPAQKVVRSLRKLVVGPADLAQAMRDYLSDDDFRTLIATLKKL